MAGLARWDETGALARLAEQAHNNTGGMSIFACMLQALSTCQVGTPKR